MAEKLKTRGTAGSSSAEVGDHRWPLGPSAPSNLPRLSRSPYDDALSLGFGASRASPPAQLVSCPNRTSRCAQLALRLSQGVPFGTLTQPLRLLGARRILRMASPASR